MKAVTLSPVDYVFTGLASQPITFAFYYRKRLDPDAIQKGLDEVLRFFPAVGSRLTAVSDTDYVFRIDKNGMNLEFNETDSGIDSLEGAEDYIVPVESCDGSPAAGITLTQLKEGSVLAVSMSHALADGFSFFHFLSSWARICRGDRFVEPFLDRDILRSHLIRSDHEITVENVLHNCGLFLEDKPRVAMPGKKHVDRVLFSREMIKSWLEEIKQEYQTACTANDVVTARLWKQYLPLWIGGEDHSSIYMTCPVDFRRVLTGFSRNYFGCALSFATASIPLDDLGRASVGDLAVLIRNAVSSVREDSILRSLKTLDNLRIEGGVNVMGRLHLRHPRRGMIVTNLTRMPIRDLDFGAGSPAEFSTYAEVSASAAVLPAEDGVEVLVMHP